MIFGIQYCRHGSTIGRTVPTRGSTFAGNFFVLMVPPVLCSFTEPEIPARRVASEAPRVKPSGHGTGARRVADESVAKCSRPETRYIWWVTFRQRVSAGRYGGRLDGILSCGPRTVRPTAKRVQAHRARARMGQRRLTVRVSDRTVRHLISTGYLSLESREAAAYVAFALEAWISDNCP